jgi:hypothetical protein
MFQRTDKIEAMAALTILIAAELLPRSAWAGPSAETARRCMHYSYVVYPYKRPGSVRGSGDRQAYFRDCMAKDGNVPPPPSANP